MGQLVQGRYKIVWIESVVYTWGQVDSALLSQPLQAAELLARLKDVLPWAPPRPNRNSFR
jgi:hypothetical protein